MRLDKFICKSTEYELAQAIKLIESKRLKVNGLTITDRSMQVHRNTVVLLDERPLKARDSRYFVCHKPLDTVCSNINDHYPSILQLLDVDKLNELHIVGRLDVNTTGLILVTDDGHWSYHLTSPNSHCPKVYQVTLSRPISDDAIDKFKQGVFMPGDPKITLPASLSIQDSYHVTLTITEGRYHQVKRMFAALGNRVKSLHRSQIGSLQLDIDQGLWRSLTQQEVNDLYRGIDISYQYATTYDSQRANSR